MHHDAMSFVCFHRIANVDAFAALRGMVAVRQGLYALCYVNRRPEMICDNNKTPAKPLILPNGESIKLGKFEGGFGARMDVNDLHFHRCYTRHRVRNECFLADDQKTLLHIDAFTKGWVLDLSAVPGRARLYEKQRWIRPLADLLANHNALTHFEAPAGAPQEYARRNGKTHAGEAYFLRSRLTMQFWEDFGDHVRGLARELYGSASGQQLASAGTSEKSRA